MGKWQSVAFDNIESLWDAMGIPEPMRQFARENRTVLAMEREGAGYRLTTVAGDKQRVVVFPLGQPVDTIDIMGKPVKAVLTEESGELVERQTGEGGEITIRRAFVDGALKTSMTAKGVTATISFQKA